MPTEAGDTLLAPGRPARRRDSRLRTFGRALIVVGLFISVPLTGFGVLISSGHPAVLGFEAFALVVGIAALFSRKAQVVLAFISLVMLVTAVVGRAFDLTEDTFVPVLGMRAVVIVGTFAFLAPAAILWFIGGGAAIVDARRSPLPN